MNFFIIPAWKLQVHNIYQRIIYTDKTVNRVPANTIISYYFGRVDDDLTSMNPYIIKACAVYDLKCTTPGYMLRLVRSFLNLNFLLLILIVFKKNISIYHNFTVFYFKNLITF